MAITITIKQFEENANSFLNSVGRAFVDMNERVAVTALSIIKERIVQDGENSKGGQLGKYTDKYARYKNKNGMNGNFVDLKATESMWKDIGVINSVESNGNVITSVAGKDTATRKGGQTTSEIMGFNAERYGDFLEASELEINQLIAVYDAELQELLDKSFS
jgi:hypothetical protein